jgi:GAF domain-containing protein
MVPKIEQCKHMTNIVPKGYAKEGEKYDHTVQNVSEQANLLTDIVAKIRSSTLEGEMLNTAVQCIRQAIGCDRAVIYSLQSGQHGTIIAESVAPVYPKTIGMKIIDPCFEARYIDKYQMGRVRAISDIYQAGMTPCYIENLEKIGVRASLVVPILSDSQTLYGLLVLHQCNAPRQWEQSEIDLTIQVAIQIGFVIEHSARLAECQKLQRQLQYVADWQRILPQVNRNIYSGRNRVEVLQITTQQTQKLLRCDRVVVYSLQGVSMGKIAAEVTKPALASIIGRMMVDPCFDRGYAIQYQNGRVRSIDNIHQAGLTPCYVQALSSIGVKASLIAPILLANGRLLGLLVAHECFEFRHWKSHEIEWVRQMAMQCGLAVGNARLQEKQVLMKSAIETLSQVRQQIHSMVSIDTQVNTTTTELESIASEIRSLIRLLKQEATKSPDLEAVEAVEPEQRNLLPIIAKRLQQHMEAWDTTLARLAPQQQQISELLGDALHSLESNRIPSK